MNNIKRKQGRILYPALIFKVKYISTYCSFWRWLIYYSVMYFLSFFLCTNYGQMCSCLNFWNLLVTMPLSRKLICWSYIEHLLQYCWKCSLLVLYWLVSWDRHHYFWACSGCLPSIREFRTTMWTFEANVAWGKHCFFSHSQGQNVVHFLPL